ncbi:unnamed protein product [Microthlaspi erraticum]|uniref:Uncharacterized protein n=1 Tax=Microthlaspi erraticum TaxID=1685480 RepID=A0A6D2II12_9BRAS|nr:unnamed protein product [Microthlaspi erraticum]
MESMVARALAHSGNRRAVTSAKGNDPSPSHHSAKKVRKALDFNVVVAGSDEAGDNMEHVVNDKVDNLPMGDEKMVNEPAGLEEGEEGELWWNEVLEEEAGEMIAEEDENQLETQDSNDVQMEGNENVGTTLAVEQFVEVEAKEVGKGNHGGRKVGIKKKAVRSNVGMGGGPLRRMVHGAKTPRKKTTAKESQRLGEKMAGKEKGPEKDPSKGSGTDLKAI